MWSYICLQRTVARRLFSLWSLPRAGAVIACLALAAGCAASPEGADGAAEPEGDALVAGAVVVADPDATTEAEVLEDRVRLPLAVAERYRTLAPASIFVGARGAPTGKNPNGFLRRVTSVAASGDALVVMTTPAILTDAILRGAVRTSSGGFSIDDHSSVSQSLKPLTRNELKGIAVDFADEPLFEGDEIVEVAGKTARFVESIRLERALLTSTPVVDIDLRIHDGKVSRFVAKVEGNLDASIRATATVTGEGDLDEQTFAELRTRKHEVRRVVYQSPHIALPTFAVGGVPISPSVQFTVTLRCTLAFGGPLVAHAGVEAKSYVRLGGVYDGAAWGPPIRSEFDIKPSFTLERGAEADARCAIEADAELFAYGISGVTMSVAPYVDFGVKAEPKASVTAPQSYRFRVDAGANGSMRGRAAVFGVLPTDLDRSLVDWKAPALLEGVTP